MRYPPPPAEHPPRPFGNVTAKALMRICDRLSRGMSLKSACGIEFVNPDRAAWRRLANEGDVFWIWAVDCIDYAEANFVGRVEEAMSEVALERDSEGRQHKDAVRAQQAILAKRSEIYMDAPKERERGSISVTIDKLQLLLQGGTNTSALIGAAFPALPDPTVLDALPEPVEASDEEGEGEDEGEDVEANRRHQPPPTARAFAFRRKGGP